MTKNTIYLYADGACIPNPGQMAIGGVLYFNGATKEFSKRTEQGTNNLAELIAIWHGLTLIKDTSMPLVVVSDSQYALGCISGKFNPSKNVELIDKIKEMCAKFPDVTYRWVRGHNGDQYNERADQLASQFFANSFDY